VSATENPQTSIYEKVVEDPALEKALKLRQAAKVDRQEANRAFNEADGKIAGLVDANPELELGEDASVRVGDFVLTLKRSEVKDVSFTRGGGTRLQISLLDE
jgi:hypothetical protein